MSLIRAPRIIGSVSAAATTVDKAARIRALALAGTKIVIADLPSLLACLVLTEGFFTDT